MIKAIAYFRTSAAGNVGSGKDSNQRQRVAIQTYAAANGIAIDQRAAISACRSAQRQRITRLRASAWASATLMDWEAAVPGFPVRQQKRPPRSWALGGLVYPIVTAHGKSQHRSDSLLPIQGVGYWRLKEPPGLGSPRRPSSWRRDKAHAPERDSGPLVAA
jgi:hypothetical protein